MHGATDTDIKALTATVKPETLTTDFANRGLTLTFQSKAIHRAKQALLLGFLQRFFCQNSLNQVSPKFNNAKVSGFTVRNGDI